MKLSDTHSFLADKSRYFTDVYKHFNFTDDQPLKDYLDFILHEPIEWLKGFPSRLLTKGSFSRPKAAAIRVLKLPEVKEALGEQYIQKVYVIIWKTFKIHAESIIADRKTPRTINVLQQITDAESIQENEIVEHQSVDNYSDRDEGFESETKQSPSHAFHTNGKADKAEKKEKADKADKAEKSDELLWEKKYRVVESALQSILETQDIHPGLLAAFKAILSALSSL